MDSSIYASYAAEGPVACVDGVAEVIAGDANNTFRCSNVSISSRAWTTTIRVVTKLETSD